MYVDANYTKCLGIIFLTFLYLFIGGRIVKTTVPQTYLTQTA